MLRHSVRRLVSTGQRRKGSFPVRSLGFVRPGSNALLQSNFSETRVTLHGRGQLFTPFGRSFSSEQKQQQEEQKTSSEETTTDESYSSGMKLLHLLVGTGIISAVLLVEIKQRVDKENKGLIGNLMYYHKSIGLAVLALIIPRIGMKLFTKSPAIMRGVTSLEDKFGRLVHASFYVPMIMLPVSGIVMGYYGGKGLPFFVTTIPAKENRTKEDGKKVGKAFKIHKFVGQVLVYMLVLHVGAVGFHFIRGHAILTRMNVFQKGSAAGKAVFGVGATAVAFNAATTPGSSIKKLQEKGTIF